MNLLYLRNPSPPEVIYAIIEVPKGSKNKYEYDHELGVFRLARVCHSSFVAPANYGFVPETWTQDEAPLDILVLTQEPLLIGVVVEVKPIGILETIAEGKEDPKILSVALGDPIYSKIDDVSKISEHFLREVSHFFAHYRELENRKIVVKEWGDKEKAKQKILNAIKEFKKLQG